MRERLRTRLALAAAAAALFAADVATAQPATTAAALPTAAPAAPDQPAQERADEAVVKQAAQSVLARGPLALAPFIQPLEEVARHAPATYPLIEQQGAFVIVRDDTINSLTVLLLAARGAVPATVVRRYNVYGRARLLLASFANEMHRPQDAERETAAGLKLQPDDPYLVSERAAALNSLHRNAEAVDLLRPWIDTHQTAPPQFRAIMLRDLGFAFTELGRLDDAQSAYEASLKLQPGHLGALSELRYIADLRAGRQKKPFGVMTSGDAAAGKTPQVTPN